MADELPPFDPEKFDGIAVTHERLLCARHGEPYRAQWPKGFAITVVALMDYIFKRDDVAAEARELAGCGPGDKPEPKVVEQVLDRIPACCRVHTKQLREVYVKAKIGTRARCEDCRRKRFGTSYLSQEREFAHLCFDCVLDPDRWRSYN
ncbi:hypothetical protein LCGC14_0413360 [marine sediment metagenome]|uniref:Uncharacterized protein n=1 Tax=marine sediment metagenome TaxID=412755 RepID=A0A0F9SZ05_9ZZZZ